MHNTPGATALTQTRRRQSPDSLFPPRSPFFTHASRWFALGSAGAPPTFLQPVRFTLRSQCSDATSTGPRTLGWLLHLTIRPLRALAYSSALLCKTGSLSGFVARGGTSIEMAWNLNRCASLDARGSSPLDGPSPRCVVEQYGARDLGSGAS